MAADEAEFDLREYETPVAVRPLCVEDHDAVVRLQQICFPGMKPWAREQFQAQVETFPEGQFAVEMEGEIVGSASCLVIDADDLEAIHSFNEVSGNGMLTTHDPEGTHLYGIEVMVHPEYRGMKIGERLYEERKELCERLNLKGILIAGRMPRYKDHDDLTPQQYVRQVLRSEIHDPVIGFQVRNGFVPKRVIADYLPQDKASKGNALLMEWSNVEYQPTPGRHLKSAHPVRVTVIQYQMRKVDTFHEFARQTEYFADVAANYGSDFAVFPELLTTQLLSAIPEKDPAKAIRELTGFTDEYIEHFTDLAVRYNVNIIGGTHIIEEEEGRLQNVAFLFRRDGTIARQYKLHITTNERRWWGIQPGTDIEVLDTDMGPIAINVCYDVEFPEMARIAVDRGARIIFVPFCTEDRQGYLRVRYCAQARAVENQVYVVTAGTVGNLPDTPNMDIQYAQSAIFTPSDFAFPRDGIAAETTPNVETVIVGDIDLEVLRRHRREGSVAQLQDRRHDLYAVKALKE